MHIIFHHLCYVHPVLVIGQWWSWTVSYTFSTVKASLYPVVLYPCLPSHFHNSCDVCFLFSCCLHCALHTAWVSIHIYNSSVWFITTWVSQNFSLKIWSCLKLVKDIPHVEKLINPVCVSKCFKISYKNNSRHAHTKKQKQILCSIASLTSCKGGEGKEGGEELHSCGKCAYVSMVLYSPATLTLIPVEGLCRFAGTAGTGRLWTQVQEPWICFYMHNQPSHRPRNIFLVGNMERERERDPMLGLYSEGSRRHVTVAK